MSQDFLGKKYVLKKSDNFDAYMKELGVGLTLRKMGNTLISQCLLERNMDDDTYTFTLETPYQKSCIHFKLDQPFKEATLDNREVKTICHLEDNNIFVQEQKPLAGGGQPTRIVRSYVGDEMIVDLTVGDVKAVRVYGVLKENQENKDSSQNQANEMVTHHQGNRISTQTLLNYQI
ncbi:fatty acid-binding protein-like [Cochliomyia hominivorax]